MPKLRVADDLVDERVRRVALRVAAELESLAAEAEAAR